MACSVPIRDYYQPAPGRRTEGLLTALTFTAAKEAGNVFCIGCDVDQYDDGVNGDKNIILTSAVVGIAQGNETQLTKIYDGTFTGQNELLGAEGGFAG